MISYTDPEPSAAIPTTMVTEVQAEPQPQQPQTTLPVLQPAPAIHYVNAGTFEITTIPKQEKLEPIIMTIPLTETIPLAETRQSTMEDKSGE